MNDQAGPVVRKRSVWHRLYHGETEFDFVGHRNIGFIISGILILITVVSLSTRELNLGLDFEGGVAWESPKGQLTDSKVHAILSANGLNPENAKIQTLSGSSGERYRIQVGPEGLDKTKPVRDELAKAAGVDSQEVNVESVSPTWGNEITRKAVRALIVFLILITLYISFRFEWRMAVGALIAVVHDVLISVGIYSVFQFPVTPATVVAFLTILGFSLYDTIVVFDKVHENTKKLTTGRFTYADIVNLSMNQVLMRSINTSLAAVLPVISLLVIGSWMLGAIALREFALALLVGLLIGSYSSIFIASPILVILKEREPRFKALKQKRQASDIAGARAASKETVPAKSAPAKSPANVAMGEAIELEGIEAPAPVATITRPTTGLTHPPRPRKKKRR